MKAHTLLRTLVNLKPAQVAYRALHIARMQAYGRLPTQAVPWMRDDPTAKSAINNCLALDTTLPDQGRVMVQLWSEGLVAYHGIEGSNRDWIAHHKSRLWQYERHYHAEIIALAHAGHTAQIERMVHDWQRACPPLKGVSWEPYPLARRVLHWSIALAACPVLDPMLAPLLAPQVRHLAWHLEKHLMGNHLLCDLFALIAGSSVLEAQGMNQIWQSAATNLRHHLLEQLLPDGGYAERTAQYHAVVLRDLLWSSALSNARGRDLGLNDQAKSMLNWAQNVSRPDGSFPWINDAAPDATPSLQSLQTLAEQTGIVQVHKANPGSGPLVLHDTGWLIHRSNQHELLFDFGVVGPKDQPGHGHCDAMAYELYWDGVPLVTDTGITTYASGPTRSYERNAEAHATVAVNNEGSDEVWASFRVGGRGLPKLLISTEAPPGTINVAAECRSFRGWLHQRTLRYTPGVSLQVQDCVSGTPKDAEAFSHVPIAPGWEITEDATGYILSHQRLSLRLSVKQGTAVGLLDGWQSEGFGRKKPRKVLAIRFQNNSAAYEISLV